MKPAIPVRRVSWNPLACSDTTLRPDLLLMAKLSWLLLLVGGFWASLHGPITPGIGLFTFIPGGTIWLELPFWVGGVCLLFNRAVRGACGVVGATVLLAPFETINTWHPYAWVCGGVLLLGALQSPGDERRFVRWFVVLVHGAALLGAIDGAGWIATALAAPWTDSDFLGAVPRWIDGLLPPGTLARGLYWGAVAVCAAIPLGLLVPWTRRATTGLALLFYTVLYLALGSTEVVLFAGAIGIAQISCLAWPGRVIVVWPRACGWPLFLRGALDRYDFERRTDWPRPPDPDADLEAWFDERPRTGARAIVHLLLGFPAFYFATLGVLTGVHALLPRFAAVPLNSGLALALVGFSVVASLRGLRARIRKRPASPIPAALAEVAHDSSSAAIADQPVTVEIDIPRRPDP